MRTAKLELTPGQGGKDFFLIHDRVAVEGGASGFALYQPGADEATGPAPDGGFLLPASVAAHAAALLDWLEAQPEATVTTPWRAHVAAVVAEKEARTAAALAQE